MELSPTGYMELSPTGYMELSPTGYMELSPQFPAFQYKQNMTSETK